jgi:hypothetical protein
MVTSPVTLLMVIVLISVFMVRLMSVSFVVLQLHLNFVAPAAIAANVLMVTFAAEVVLTPLMYVPLSSTKAYPPCLVRHLSHFQSRW